MSGRIDNSRIDKTHDLPAFNDLMVPINATKLGGSKDPDFAVFKTNGTGSQGVFIYWFDSSTEEEVYFVIQLPHSWKGTTIRPHVHWTPAVTADGDPADQKVSWGLEYTWASIGESFSNTSIVYGNTHVPADANVVAGKHYLSPLSQLTPSAIQDDISSMLLCRLFRNATDAVNDTYENDVGLLEFDFHIELDAMGSRQEFIK